MESIGEFWIVRDVMEKKKRDLFDISSFIWISTKKCLENVTVFPADRSLSLWSLFAF